MIIVCQNLFKNTKILGIAIFPFILLSKKELKNNKILLNHEKIHFRQQLELGIIFFYLWYAIEFLFYFIKYKNRHIAYFKISFEREAYANEHNPYYLKNRKLWAFRKYL
ncbi:MAG: hypothetical protein Q4A00_03895 [Flavobacteriaceae bacterium]|nr:hypothetical protein [Flavobacteriaceae bacterium]